MRPVKRLALARETVRLLVDGELGRVVGGEPNVSVQQRCVTPDCPPSHAYTCVDTEGCAPSRVGCPPTYTATPSGG